MNREREEHFAASAKAVEESVDDRAALELAWARIHGTYPKRNRGGDNAENRFVSMLDCRAFESAALALKPDGCSWAAGDTSEDDMPWACITANDDTAGHPDFRGGDSGCSVACAIAAAALRAEGNRKFEGDEA